MIKKIGTFHQIPNLSWLYCIYSWVCSIFCPGHRWWSPPGHGLDTELRVVHGLQTRLLSWSHGSEREPPAVSNCGIWKNPVQNDISKPIMAFIIIIILRLWPQSNDTVSSTFLSENISARREWGRQQPVAIWTLHSFQLGIYCQLLAFRETQTEQHSITFIRVLFPKWVWLQARPAVVT